MPSSKKRSSRQMSDSDDSDDDLLESVFGGSRSSKRRAAKDEKAKKEQRMAQMNALLNNGRVKLERENRIDKLCLENNNLLRDDGLDEEKKEKNTDGGKSDNDATCAEGSVDSAFQQYQPKDSKETSCLGSRITLQFSREVPVQRRADESLSSDANEKGFSAFAPFWFGFEEALTDLRTILAADRQKQQSPSSLTTLREELLRLCKTNSPYACRTYLRKALMSRKKDQDQIRRIHVNVLRWLMALACGPVANENITDCGNSSQNKTEIKQEKQKMKQTSLRPQNLTAIQRHAESQQILMEAQTGAYQTLYRLWSQDLGCPLQEQKRAEIYMLSIRALPRQLHLWFGSSFSFESDSSSGDKSDKMEETKNDTVRVVNCHTTLVRFLNLWALALQKQNSSDDVKDSVHLVEFHYDENREGFRNHVSDAIMAVLWAGLHPSFASSISAKDDGNRSIQTIVSCLLDRVRRENQYYKNNDGGDENIESFEQWMESLSERIITTWSQKLGRGRKGTDAYEDTHAWLSLARSVTRLVRIDGSDYSCGGLKGYDYNDFQLTLCRCILKRAFVAEADGQKVLNDETSSEGNRINIDGKSNDWVSPLFDEEMRRMEVPVGIRSSHRWKAMALAIAGLVKLASSFPEDEASKCFALMDICTVCFHSAIVELEPEIQKHCPKEKKVDFDDDGGTLALTNDNSEAIALSSVEAGVLEKNALYRALLRLGSVSEIISTRTRALIMRNVCFTWASQMAESLRHYVSSHKGKYATQSVASSGKQQSRINAFFKSTTTGRE